MAGYDKYNKHLCELRRDSPRFNLNPKSKLRVYVAAIRHGSIHICYGIDHAKVLDRHQKKFLRDKLGEENVIFHLVKVKKSD